MSGDHNRKILCDIAHSAFAAVNSTLARDQLLARGLRSSQTQSRQIYREECITVEMAATLLEQFPEHIEVTLFSAKEERGNGADWYWRIERDNCAIHARVQAKRVRRTDFGQPDDLGQVEIDGPQLERLIQAASNVTDLPDLQAWFATFARFNATPPCGHTTLLRCQNHMHMPTCLSSQPSLWIAQAQDILKLSGAGKKQPVRAVVADSLRLDCLLPCIGGARVNANAGPLGKGFALQSGLKSYLDCIAAIESDPMLLKQFEGALRIKI